MNWTYIDIFNRPVLKIAIFVAVSKGLFECGRERRKFREEADLNSSNFR